MPERPRIRLASVSYLNALPLNYGLVRGRHRDRFEVLLRPPHECARLLQEGLVDVALIPSIEFARTSGLQSIPGTGIASRAEVRSVLLLSKVDPPRIRSLAADLNSRTSVELTRLILLHRYRARPRVAPAPPDPAAMLEDHDAALIIGDAALKAVAGPGLLVMDLAREWHEMTGLPFVFAFWACRGVVPAEPIREVLESSLQEGLARIDAISGEEASRTGLSAELISGYLRRNIHYRLGAEERSSLRVYFRMCFEQGLIARAPADRTPSTSAGIGIRPAPPPRLPHGL